jgi:Mrp family chromosome partitioning ATPase/capsular polysaccharide biosynthesis protein
MTGPTFAAPSPATPATPGAPPATPKSSPPSNTRPTARPGAQPDDGAGLRMLTYLRLHWLMIVFCGTLIGTGGAILAWELLASKYESYALLQVSSAPTALANQNNPHQAKTEFVTYLKTTSALIKSEFVLNAALRDIKDLPTIKAQSDPIKYLDEELQVTWQDGSEVIRVSFKGTEPQDAKKIVDAVQNAFMNEVVQKDVNEKKIFLKKVEDAQAEMLRILNGKAGDKAKPGPVVPAGGIDGQPAPGAPPAPGMLPDSLLYKLDPSILIRQVVDLRKQADQLPLMLRDSKRREEVLKEKLDALKKAPIPQSIIDMVDKDQDLIVEKLRMVRDKTEYSKKGTSGDENSEGVQRLKAAYELQKKRYEDLREEKIKTLDGLRRLEEAKKIAAELEEIIRAGQRYQEQLDHAKAQLAKAEKQLAELPLPSEKNANGILPVKFEDKDKYSPELTSLVGTDEIYRKLILQYYQTYWELNSPRRVSVIQTASHPVQKDMKKQYLGTGFAGLMGFVLMALGVIAYETVSRRVSSLADVKCTVPSPIVGVVPAAPTEAMGRDPAKRAAANEAVDKLRAYVSQTWLSRGATTIAVTSPIGDEGKAFTAFGLASSLAQAGYKTLLVDFDLREPALHAYAGVPNLAGVCELLRAETDMRSAVQFLPSGLHLLPAGKWSDEARKAATGEKLETVLAKMKEPYDCVVIHGHALLTVAESVEVARRCEVVLVCARYRETAMPLLKSATERVATMEIPYTGIVYVGATESEALC